MKNIPSAPHPRAALFDGLAGLTQIGEIWTCDDGAIGFEVHHLDEAPVEGEPCWITTLYLTSNFRDGLWIGQNYAGRQVAGTTQFRLPADLGKARRAIRRYFAL